MRTHRLPNSLLSLIPSEPRTLEIPDIAELQKAASVIREILASNDHEKIFKSPEMANDMKFESDLNRELLPLLNLLASINHLSIYVGTLAGSHPDDQQLVSLDVASVSLIDGLLQFDCDLGEEIEIEAGLRN